MAITTKLSSAAVLLIAVLTFFSAVDAGRASRGVSWADWSRRDGVPVHVKQLEQLSDADSDEEYYRKGIRFELYTIQNPEEPELMDIYSSEIPETTLFDPRRPTKVAVHGWQSNSHGLIQLRSAFLAVGDVNFISVNWADIDTIVYPLSSYHVPLIGQRVAYLLDFLRLMYGVPLSSVHVIGHSLGAHISGLAGSMTEWGKVGRIT
ncbi:Pancreatic triacylglycerol lipase, partial [Frankliniella fusca]